MNQLFVRRFQVNRLLHKAMFQDDSIALRPLHYYPFVMELDEEDVIEFSIIDLASRKKAGEIALRFGDGTAMYYLGHIGYHVDPEFRGHSYAFRACKLVLPVFEDEGFSSLVITTDLDNQPSRKTCEKLGCVLESYVPVPKDVQIQFQLSNGKCRYIYAFSDRFLSP